MARPRTVAVVVPSPATSFVLEATSCNNRAPRFWNLSLRVTALATVTPSGGRAADVSRVTQLRHCPRIFRGLTLGDLGRAVARFYQDVAALGPEGCGDGPGEGVDTSQESGTALNTKLDILSRRDGSDLQLRWPSVSRHSYLVGEAQLLTQASSSTMPGGGRGQSRNSSSGAQGALHVEWWKKFSQ